jgi:dipeptidase E
MPETQAGRELLLLSNTVMPGMHPLEHALEAIDEFLAGRRTVCFLPYALADHDAYTERMRLALAPLSTTIVGLHRLADPLAAIDEAEAIFVGGGNTFRLLLSVQRLGLMEGIEKRVTAGGLRYLGTSAGTNLACPTIRTTNDMPIVQPYSFDALGLVPFQINPHYLDPNPKPLHMGETREQRLREFLQENDVAIVGLREGAWLRRGGASIRLGGRSGARLFRRGTEPEEYAPGADLSWLLDLAPRFDVR